MEFKEMKKKKIAKNMITRDKQTTKVKTNIHLGN